MGNTIIRQPHGKVKRASPRKENLTGKVFGRLAVVREATDKEYLTIHWVCQCKCGNITIARGASLKNGCVKSCGCLRSELVADGNTTHGMTNHPLYVVWKGMRQRCSNPNHVSYGYYGGKGVRVCEEWDSDFMLFYDWCMKEGYVSGLTVDRVDGECDYTPGNCKMSTRMEQSHNSSNVKLDELSVRKIKASIKKGARNSELGRKYGVTPEAISCIRCEKTWGWVT